MPLIFTAPFIPEYMVNLAHYFGRNFLGFSAIHETRKISGPADLLLLPDNADKKILAALTCFFSSFNLLFALKP